MSASLSLFPDAAYWCQVRRCDPRARELADRHYSRQTIGAVEFTGPGKVFVLLGADEKAVWGVVEAFVPGGPERRWRCSIFRNETGGAMLSSDLIRTATVLTYAHWERRYHGRPAVPLTTEINPGKVRRKRDPGRCFRRAGWREVAVRNGLIVLQAPS